MKKTIIFLILLLGCNPNKKTSNNNLIYIVNITTMDRKMIADFIRKVNSCQPKVIGINAIFDRSEKTNDTIFANSIKDSRNVILVSDLAEDESLVNSDSIFVNQALGNGVTTFNFSGDILSYYQTFKTINGQITWSFPVTIASYFKEGTASEIMKKTKANVNYEILMNKTIDEYQLITDTDLKGNKCVDLRGKIVLMGDVGPRDGDLFLINEGGDKAYSTIVIANVIESLLAGEFIEVTSNRRSL